MLEVGFNVHNFKYHELSIEFCFINSCQSSIESLLFVQFLVCQICSWIKAIVPSLYYIEINFLFIFQCWILHSGWSGTWKIVVDSNQQLQWHDYRAWPCPLCTPCVNVWFWRPSGYGRLRTYSSHVFTNSEFSICIFFFLRNFLSSR